MWTNTILMGSTIQSSVQPRINNPYVKMVVMFIYGFSVSIAQGNGRNVVCSVSPSLMTGRIHQQWALHCTGLKTGQPVFWLDGTFRLIGVQKLLPNLPFEYLVQIYMHRLAWQVLQPTFHVDTLWQLLKLSWLSLWHKWYTTKNRIFFYLYTT